MKFKSFSAAGPKGENQDAILLPFRVGNGFWCAIADGVGSSTLGGIAAQASIQAVAKASQKETMEDIFDRAKKALNKIKFENLSKDSVSTTLSVLNIINNEAFIGHVGDTRISHYRGKGVMIRTKDQTEVQKLLDDGVLSKPQAIRYPRRNVLLSAMSSDQEYDLYKNSFTLQAGDRILLTTDGFHDVIQRRRIAEISASKPSFDEFWESLRNNFQAGNLKDDASCLAIEID